MLIERIKASGFLSFGPSGMDLSLRRLNVLIGPNGSGKSNLVELFALLQRIPKGLPRNLPGGNREWFWKGEARKNVGTLETVHSSDNTRPELRHGITFFYAEDHDFYMPSTEQIEFAAPGSGKTTSVYSRSHGEILMREYPSRNDGGALRKLNFKEIDIMESIICQFRDPDVARYPMFRRLESAYADQRIYRNWFIGPDSPLRRPQVAAGPADVVSEDLSNYQRVLWNLRKTSLSSLREYLPAVYEGAQDFHLDLLGDTMLLSILEKGLGYIPISRLSDGTIRYLCLLAILLNPKPSPLIVIDEPDLGLHPDLMPTLVKLLERASQRTQIIVTTHSRQLIDALSDQPESVVVCSKDADGTHFERLNAEDLAVWLERYSLGQLWSRGELGGNRW